MDTQSSLSPFSFLGQPAGMSSVVLVLVVVLLCGLALAIALYGRGRARYPYEAQPGLFTRAELNFHKALAQAVSGRAAISAKVRIADVLRVKKSRLIGKKAWWRAFTKISSKHVDFVLYDLSSGRILGAIELDDRSHERRDRKKRDVFVNRAFEAAGVPLIRVTNARSYDRAALGRQVGALIGG